MDIKKRLEEIARMPLKECSDEKIYCCLSTLIDELKHKDDEKKNKKKLYYISAEFLIGKLLVSNLSNLGIYDEVKKVLANEGKDIDRIEEMETEPSLGNGGLGRLAACFMDSVASLGLDGDGIGLLYHFGLFRQVFKDNKQTEDINPWLEKSQFVKDTGLSFSVHFNNFDVVSSLKDIDIIGYGGKVNKLHLFDIQTIDESIVKGGISYDKTDIRKNLTLFLYPDDSDENGRKLRIYQQYFMASCAAQLIIKECIEKGSNLYDLYEYAVIQINDTHPTLIIPELIRILTQKGIDMDTAISIVQKTCAYTNHTILAEALEKWPIGYLKNTVGHLVPIIEILDNKIRRKTDDKRVYIIDDQERVHMAHIDIHYSFSTNGVASLHTKILKENELNHFYNMYPERFNNKTNGITLRRWLTQSNPELDRFLETLIGKDFKTDHDRLKDLLKYKDDIDVLQKLCEIKQHNKVRLKNYLKSTMGIEIDENSVFDIQIKRLHEYKRQQLNVLYLINKYLDIKDGILPQRPITAIFGAKAAPAYTIAKDIIHLILCLGEIIKKDPLVSKHLNVVMVENYNVTNAQYIIPSCDISEQISLASKEASGTGNMKLMLNGAVTLGTEDGANVEIHSLVGDDNIYIFGHKSDEVIEKYKSNSYVSRDYYNSSPKIKRAVDFITDNKMVSSGCGENLHRLKNELINKDYFMTFPDFDAYCNAKEKALADYEARHMWAKKMLINIANAGYFSSDRTIKEYNNDIWKLN
jgi:starch phosphorylase